MSFDKKILNLTEKLISVLNRLDLILPPESKEPDWTAVAYKWEKVGFNGVLHSLPHPHTFSLSKLKSIEDQMQQLVGNTEQFLDSKPANNVLLSGARGTGKSSLVKSLLFEYAHRGLRLIEVDKSDLLTLPKLLDILILRPEKFIIFCDDLSFEEGEKEYKMLKTVLDGNLSVYAENVLVYATSNRRHLMPESMADNFYLSNQSGEIHPEETIEEKVSLSDRFGLWLHFYSFSQEDYLSSVKSWIDDAKLEWNEDVQRAALNWALSRGDRSGRVARQFTNDWIGKKST